MTASSNLGYYERIDADALSDTEPVSAAVAYVMRNNLLHLRDQFTKHVINWSSLATSASADMVLNTGDAEETGIWSATFLHTWLDSVTPTNLDYLTSVFFVSSGNHELRLRVIPHYRPGASSPWLAGDAAADSYALIDVSDTGTGATATITLDGRETFTSAAAQRIANSIDSINLNGLYAAIDEDGSAPAMDAYVMRAELFITSDVATNVFQLQMQLREYV